MNLDLAARELLRAIRGARSQQAFARRLGYRSNVVAKWEAGRRMPNATEALRACARAGIDVPKAFIAFHPASAPSGPSLDDAAVAAWLRAQRGARPIAPLAARAGVSRYTMSRFLSGETRPRLPELLAVIDALTGRLPEWVALLVDITRVPSLRAAYDQVQASRNAAFEEPWSSLVLALLTTGRYGPPLHRAAGELARALGSSTDVAEHSLRLLRDAGVIRVRAGHYHVKASLVVDTRSNPTGALLLRDHASRVSHARLHAAQPDDLFSYNVFSVSRADYARMRALQLEFFRQMRALAAESEPSELAGLMVLHLMQWSPDQAGASS